MPKLRTEPAQSINDAIGRAIVDLRRQRGWSGETLAELIGVPFGTWQRRERDQSNILAADLLLVAKALETSPASILQKAESDYGEGFNRAAKNVTGEPVGDGDPKRPRKRASKRNASP